MFTKYCGKQILLLSHSKIDVSNLMQPYHSEMRHAFRKYEIELVLVDLNKQEDLEYLYSSFQDPEVLFYLDLNGLGNSVSFRNPETGKTFTTHQMTEKPSIHLVGDPIFTHEIWSNLNVQYRNQILLFSDYTSMFSAKQLRDSAAKLFFYDTFAVLGNYSPENNTNDYASRNIDVLLALSLSEPDFFYSRLIESQPKRKDITKRIFQAIVDKYLFEYRSDPFDWVNSTFHQFDLHFDIYSDWHRSMLSEIWHYIRQKRRECYLNELRDSPICLVTRNVPKNIKINENTKVLKNLKFDKLLKLMEDTKVVINPPVSYRGFHERVVSAMYRSATVISAPNQLFESHFIHGEDIIFLESHQELKDSVDYHIANPNESERIGKSGQSKAIQQFNVEHSIDMILTIFSNHSA